MCSFTIIDKLSGCIHFYLTSLRRSGEFLSIACISTGLGKPWEMAHIVEQNCTAGMVEEVGVHWQSWEVCRRLRWQYRCCTGGRWRVVRSKFLNVFISPGSILELAMRLREYAVHADCAHICKYAHAYAAQNPHEPHIKAKLRNSGGWKGGKNWTS